jgi:hypothetical protein
MANKNKDLVTKAEMAVFKETKMAYPEEFMIDPADPIFKKRVKLEKARKIYENMKSAMLGKIKNKPKWTP